MLVSKTGGLTRDFGRKFGVRGVLKAESPVHPLCARGGRGLVMSLAGVGFDRLGAGTFTAGLGRTPSGRAGTGTAGASRTARIAFAVIAVVTLVMIAIVMIAIMVIVVVIVVMAPAKPAAAAAAAAAAVSAMVTCESRTS